MYSSADLSKIGCVNGEGRGGGMHKMGRYAYSLVDAVAANKTFLMWMKLKGACCARSTELPSTPKKF
jgi:hypothetical protein